MPAKEDGSGENRRVLTEIGREEAAAQLVQSVGSPLPPMCLIGAASSKQGFPWGEARRAFERLRGS